MGTYRGYKADVRSVLFLWVVAFLVVVSNVDDNNGLLPPPCSYYAYPPVHVDSSGYSRLACDVSLHPVRIDP